MKRDLIIIQTNSWIGFMQALNVVEAVMKLNMKMNQKLSNLFKMTGQIKFGDLYSFKQW